MTLEIAFVFFLLLGALVLFVSEKCPMDLVALLVLGSLALTKTVTLEQAFSGFSNPAVVTVWAMFILSDGLTRTGIADIMGRIILKLVGRGETRIVTTVMLSACCLSAFMSNIGVAALLLPVTMDIAGKTRVPPSQLLMPLAYGTLLGGLTTLIGTPPNLLASEALNLAGERPFGLFDYSPIGLAIMLTGVGFTAFWGRKLLPRSAQIDASAADHGDLLLAHYGLAEKTMVLEVGEDSRLHGLSLSNTRFGTTLELSVLAVKRNGEVRVGPKARNHIYSGDQLLVQGRPERFYQAKDWSKGFGPHRPVSLSRLAQDPWAFAEVRLAEQGPITGKTLAQVNYPENFQVSVIAQRSGVSPPEGPNLSRPLVSGDTLLLAGHFEVLLRHGENAHYAAFQMLGPEEADRRFQLAKHLFETRIPEGSPLVGRPLASCRWDKDQDYRIVGMGRQDKLDPLPDPGTTIQANDLLLVQGLWAYPGISDGLKSLEESKHSGFGVNDLKGKGYGFAEAVVPPRSGLALKTLQRLNFYDRYELQILAVWRQGEVFRTDLRHHELHFGDAFLLFGRRKHLDLLHGDRDFLLLTGTGDLPKDTRKAPLAALIMLAMLVPVVLGLLSIAVAAICAAVAMVLSGCLTMAQAYRSIEWRAIFLIAGMLPLGLAMEDTGAAALMAEGAVGLLGQLGPWPVIAGLYLVTAAATTIIPTAALVVMMAPIVLKASADLGIPPQTAMMAVAMAASASFTSPISHPANLLVMAPGGYRFVDYLKAGGPLALVVFLTTFLLLPLFWPI